MIREFSIIDYFTLVISTYQNELFRCGKNSYFKNIEGLEEIAHDIIHLVRAQNLPKNYHFLPPVRNWIELKNLYFKLTMLDQKWQETLNGSAWKFHNENIQYFLMKWKIFFVHHNIVDFSLRPHGKKFIILDESEFVGNRKIKLGRLTCRWKRNTRVSL